MTLSRRQQVAVLDEMGGSDWARRFDDAAEQIMIETPHDILKLTEHADYHASVPTPDHFIPLLYTAGLAAHGDPVEATIKGYAMGSLSMTSDGVGLDQSEARSPR